MMKHAIVMMTTVTAYRNLVEIREIDCKARNQANGWSSPYIEAHLSYDNKREKLSYTACPKKGKEILHWKKGAPTEDGYGSEQWPCRQDGQMPVQELGWFWPIIHEEPGHFKFHLKDWDPKEDLGVAKIDLGQIKYGSHRYWIKFGKGRSCEIVMTKMEKGCSATTSPWKKEEESRLVMTRDGEEAPTRSLIDFGINNGLQKGLNLGLKLATGGDEKDGVLKNGQSECYDSKTSIGCKNGKMRLFEKGENLGCIYNTCHEYTEGEKQLKRQASNKDHKAKELCDKHNGTFDNACRSQCSRPKSTGKELTHIGFASCYNQYAHPHGDVPIFKQISLQRPDWFFWLGDAAYATEPTLKNLKNGFEQTSANPDYQELIDKIPVDGIWDDHDLGPNDADRTMDRMKARKNLFLDFLHVSKKDERRTHRAGLYFSKTLGEPGKKVKLLFLDTRTLRQTYYTFDRNQSCYDYLWEGCHLFENKERHDAYIKEAEQKMANKNERNGKDPYLLLGRKQHEWIEQELYGSDAQVHVLISGIQFFSLNTEMENWMHWHTDRERLFQTLYDTNPSGLIFLSGDVHRAEEFKLGDTYLEMTSSGVNRGTLSEPMVAGQRLPKVASKSLCGQVGMNYCKNNFGMLEFDWYNRVVKVTARGEDGNVKLSWERRMDDKVAHTLRSYQKVDPASIELSGTLQFKDTLKTWQSYWKKIV